MTIVEARFAGGPIVIDEAVDTLDQTRRLVKIDAPGFDTALFPHEARALAKALQDAAASAETRTTRLRRSRDIDDELREVEN